MKGFFRIEKIEAFGFPGEGSFLAKEISLALQARLLSQDERRLGHTDGSPG